MNRTYFTWMMRRWTHFLVGTLALSWAQAQETELIGHWEFSPDRAQNSGLRAVVGKEVTFSGGPRLMKDPPPARLELPGRDEGVLISSTLEKPLLPVRELTASAWVRVDRVTAWGGLIGAVQDNGEFERGWILGFVNTNFSLALASEKGGRLTYLAATKPFETNRWYHVAGTYDGTEMRVYLNGEPVGSSLEQAGPILYPPTAPFVIGAYRDDDERYPLAGALNEVRLYRRALAAAEIQAQYQARKSKFPEPAPSPRFFKPNYGPFVDWRDRSSAVVTWETETAQPTRLTLEAPDGRLQELGDGSSHTQHSVLLTELEPEREYHYRLVGPAEGSRPVISRRYQFDTSFYYRPVPAPPRPLAKAETVATRAESILKESGVRQGYCLLFGSTNAQLAVELVRQSDLDLVLVESDARLLPALRETLDAAGIQGVRASVQHLTGTQLPYGDLIANLLVVDGPLPPTFPAAELHRVLRPVGGTLIVSSALGDEAAWQRWQAGSAFEQAELSTSGDVRLRFQRGKLPGGGEWGHQYGGPDNSSCSQDELVKGELQVAWWGDPGPRPMPDRGNRNPAPLSVNGRLFIQGDRILFGLDAYNGAILWNFSAPEVRRANVTRDCSNMAASGDTLYLAHGRWCLAVDGQTGQRRTRFEVPQTDADGPRDWSYVAAGRDLLVGSRVKTEGAYLGDDGEWYEEFAPDQVNRVTSDRLFALDPQSGKTLWEYARGAILNSTITLGDGMILFLESRNPAAVKAASSRIPNELLTEQFLVCLDQRTGRQLWEKGHDFSACEFMTYLVYAQNTVVVTGTDNNKNYHNFAFNAPSANRPEGGGDDLASAVGGHLLWSESHKEDKGHHSGHLQHPVVIGDVFFSDQRSFNLVTGETQRRDLPERRGCGIMSASKNAIFFRNHFHSMWDLATDKRTQFEGIRSGCWLSLIPAGGLLLAPETSAGCSCTHAIQTSIGYIPKYR